MLHLTAVVGVGLIVAFVVMLYRVPQEQCVQGGRAGVKCPTFVNVLYLAGVYNATYPLTPAQRLSSGAMQYRIAVVTDRDLDSKTSGDAWVALMRYGYLTYKPVNLLSLLVITTGVCRQALCHSCGMPIRLRLSRHWRKVVVRWNSVI
jgi:NADH:ubiquinone oxidoreductase subunit 6 (subunit J)